MQVLYQLSYGPESWKTLSSKSINVGNNTPLKPQTSRQTAIRRPWIWT